MKNFTCSYQKKCSIKTQDVLNEKGFKQNTLVFDFKIKSFKCLNFGWKEYPYPLDVLPSINDKLYLSLDNVIDLLFLIEDFEKKQYISLLSSSTTARGYDFFEFKDIKGNTISVQNSSNIEPAIWFGAKVDENKVGCIEAGVFKPYTYPIGELLIEDRLHIKHYQVKEFKNKVETEMMPLFNDIHNIDSLVRRNNKTVNSFIVKYWNQLKSDSQRIFFGRACCDGNLDLVKKIYINKNNIFLEDIFSPIEEYGIELSMQPESKKILKFFKDKMKENSLDYSPSFKGWIRENKLGKKLKLA